MDITDLLIWLTVFVLASNGYDLRHEVWIILVALA